MVSSDKYDMLFIGGDLSGIQKYLYNITSKKAAVSLKGRSFYLRKYMENVCNEIESKLHDNGTEVIYCSGGKFYIKTRNNSETLNVLEDFAKKTKSEIWKKHYGQLSINISVVPFSENVDGSINANGMENQKLGYLWKCLTEDFARQKNQKFIDEMTGNYDAFFNVIEVGGTPKVCAVTGIESPDCVKFRYKDDKDDSEAIYVLPIVSEQIKLGEDIRSVEKFHQFNDYAGNTYLGILRMDVDGLGKMFANGFPTLNEYKDFSSRLDSYFTSRPEADYISNLQMIQQKPDYKEHLNLVYAGGDDIFAVGRWDKIIDFAAEVRNDFVDYIDQEGVSISGGVAIVNPKFPIAKAAELAGMAEDAAKGYKYLDANGEEHIKDSFCLFGQPVSWKYEYDYVKRYKEEFVDLVNIFDMPRGILHKIMSYAKIAEDNDTKKAKGKAADYSYVWHTAYYLTRMIERESKNKPVVDFCKRLRDHELSRSANNYRLLALAARWAEQTLRIDNK